MNMPVQSEISLDSEHGQGQGQGQGGALFTGLSDDKSIESNSFEFYTWKTLRDFGGQNER